MSLLLVISISYVQVNGEALAIIVNKSAKWTDSQIIFSKEKKNSYVNINKRRPRIETFWIDKLHDLSSDIEHSMDQRLLAIISD